MPSFLGSGPSPSCPRRPGGTAWTGATTSRSRSSDPGKLAGPEPDPVTRDVPPVPDEDLEPEPGGRVEPTGPGPLVVLGAIGLFVGWAVRGQAIRSGAPTPMISWLAVVVT